MSGARPMEIVASTDLMSVSRVFVLFHYLLWKAKLDLTALSEYLDSWSINVSSSTGSIASCGVMKTPSCIIQATSDFECDLWYGVRRPYAALVCRCYTCLERAQSFES